MIAIILAGGTAMLLGLIGTRTLIVFFRQRGQGQPILGKEDLGPEHHMGKQGTPTMGGLAIVVAAFAGWLVAHLRPGLTFSDQGLIVWIGIFAMAFMGFLDDYIKVRKRHNRGIFWKQKNYVTLLMSMGLAWWLVTSTGISQTISLTRADLPGWEVPTAVWVIWAGVIIWATTNAVNVTDGLDGLASGSALMGFAAFVVIGYWVFRNPSNYAAVNPLDMTVLAAAFAGACVGFLWYNAAPARIFMGDVGALGIGAALAFLALTMNTHMLLLLICGLNVLEAGSVAVQMGVFRATGRRKRLLRMSPIHHHFELLGWPETTVIIRFWILSAISVAAALGLFISDFTSLAGGSL